MNIPKLSNVPALEELRREMDRLFENFIGSTPGELIGLRKYPPIDVWEEGESLMVRAEMPGVAMEHLEVYARGSELTLKGFRPAASGTSANVHRQEQHGGEFERKISLPIEIDAERIQATLADGLLTIRVPKPAMAQARKIAVRGEPSAPASP
jgi:HSP20 family protein